MEDESGRIELDIKEVASYMWVTGTTLGVSGYTYTTGQFKVESVVEAGIPSQPARTISSPDASSKYVAFVSGLHYGSDNAEFALARSLLVDMLCGNVQVRVWHLFDFNYNQMSLL